MHHQSVTDCSETHLEWIQKLLDEVDVWESMPLELPLCEVWDIRGLCVAVLISTTTNSQSVGMANVGGLCCYSKVLYECKCM